MNKVTDPAILARLNGKINYDFKQPLSEADQALVDADAKKEAIKSLKKVTDPAILAKLNGIKQEPIEIKPQTKEGLTPQTQQAIRMTAGAASALPGLVIDLPLQAGGWLGNRWNKATGRSQNTTRLAPVEQSREAFLQMLGVDPNPANTTERIAQAGLNALTSAGMASYSGLPAWLSAKPAQQVAGAMSSVVASGLAQEADLPEWAQITAGIGGGLAGAGTAAMAGGIVGGAGKVGKALLSQGELDDIAARALYRQTTNPQLSIERLSNPNLYRENLPGSYPITAEIAGDSGIAMAGKSMAANPVAVSEGLDQIHQARMGDIAQKATNQLNLANRVKEGGEDVLNKLDRIKKESYNKFVAGKDLQAIPVNSTFVAEIDKQLQKFAGNDVVEKFLNKVKNNAIGDDPANIKFNRAWNARQALDGILYETKLNPLLEPGVKNSVDVAGGAVRTALNNALVDAAPDFKDFLRRYAHAEGYKTALATGRKVAEKLKTNAITPAQNADDITGVNNVSSFQAQKVNNALTDLAGNQSEFSKILTKRQQKTFENIANELRRSQGMTLGAGAGSPTAAYLGRGNLLTNDILDSLLGFESRDSSLTHLLRAGSKGIGAALEKTGLTLPLEASIVRKVGDGLIDPKEGLRLLQIGQRTAQGPMNFKENLKNTGKAGLISALLAR